MYRKRGPARVFTRERDVIAAIKAHAAPATARAAAGADGANNAPAPIRPGDVIVLAGRGPLGAGMEETYQVTSALRYLEWGREVAVVTDARFSGVSTGACIGHVSPEALAGGPIGKVREGDEIEIIVDTRRLVGSVNLVGESLGPGQRARPLDSAGAARLLAERPMHDAIRPDERMPPASRLWAALQRASGGVWAGCVYDVEKILATLAAGEAALASQRDHDAEAKKR